MMMCSLLTLFKRKNGLYEFTIKFINHIKKIILIAYKVLYFPLKPMLFVTPGGTTILITDLKSYLKEKKY